MTHAFLCDMYYAIKEPNVFHLLCYSHLMLKSYSNLGCMFKSRDGLQPLDLDVGKWLRKHAPGMKTIVVMNKAELLDNVSGSLGAAAGEAYTLGFGDPIALSAETGFGLAELSEALRPLLEDFVLQNIDGKFSRF